MILVSVNIIYFRRSESVKSAGVLKNEMKLLSETEKYFHGRKHYRNSAFPQLINHKINFE